MATPLPARRRLLPIPLACLLAALPAAGGAAEGAGRVPDAFRRDLVKLQQAAQKGDHIAAFTQASIFFKRWPVSLPPENVESIRRGLLVSYSLLAMKQGKAAKMSGPSLINKLIDAMVKAGTKELTENEEFKLHKKRAIAALGRMSKFLDLAYTSITAIQTPPSIVPEPALAREHPEAFGSDHTKLSIAFFGMREFMKAERTFDFELDQMRSAAVPAQDLKRYEDIRDWIVEKLVGSLVSSGVGGLFTTVTSRVGILVVGAGKEVAGTVAGKLAVGHDATPADIMTSVLKGAAVPWVESKLTIDFSRPVQEAFSTSGL